MLPTLSLVGLACLIANKGPLDTAPIEAQLSESERDQVQTMIQEGACLPDKLEKLLKDTEEQIKSGKIGNASRLGSPTESSF